MTIRQIYAEHFEEILLLDPTFEFPDKVMLDGKEYTIDEINIH